MPASCTGLLRRPAAGGAAGPRRPGGGLARLPGPPVLPCCAGGPAAPRGPPRRRQNRGRPGTPPPVRAIDAAFEFDGEGRARAVRERQSRLRIGIVGFGNFGQFLARRMVQQGHTVLATSRGDYREAAAAMGATFYPDVDDFCEEHPEVVVLCSSILSTEQVLAGLPLQRLKRRTLFVDVLSVKVFPKQVMLKVLPPEVDILCTHPMFGPDSGKGSWKGLPMVFDKVRIGEDEVRERVCRDFLAFFAGEGCEMVEMTCEDHDKKAASTQFITHTVGRMLGEMGLEKTDIDTKGFESLLSLVENTSNDSFDLYYGLFMYNQNATEELDRLEKAFDDVKKQLFDQLRDVVRSQLFSDEQSRSAR